MKKSLIMLTLVGTIMASSTVAFGYDNVAVDSTAETVTAIETPVEKSTNSPEEKAPKHEEKAPKHEEKVPKHKENAPKSN